MSQEEYTREEQDQIRVGLENYNAYPVFVDKKILADYTYYYDYVITPVFHNFVSYKNNAGVGNPESLIAYRKVNEAFAEVILQVRKKYSKAMILFNDPYFLLAPKMITEVKNAHLGYFFHSPFPSGEIYRILPHSQEVRIIIKPIVYGICVVL